MLRSLPLSFLASVHLRPELVELLILLRQTDLLVLIDLETLDASQGLPLRLPLPPCDVVLRWLRLGPIGEALLVTEGAGHGPTDPFPLSAARGTGLYLQEALGADEFVATKHYVCVRVPHEADWALRERVEQKEGRKNRCRNASQCVTMRYNALQCVTMSKCECERVSECEEEEEEEAAQRT